MHMVGIQLRPSAFPILYSGMFQIPKQTYIFYFFFTFIVGVGGNSCEGTGECVLLGFVVMSKNYVLNCIHSAGFSKLQCKRDTIINSLADLGLTRDLAERLFGAGMITRRIYNQARNFAPGEVEVDRATGLFNAVLASVELNPMKYDMFISILMEMPGSEDIVSFIEGKALQLVNSNLSSQIQ